jgi:CDP-diacylglycerol--glycerol-3-phosphate 3-phosphatidyltransferase
MAGVNVLDWLGDSRAVLPLALVLVVALVAAFLESALGLVLFVPAGPLVIVAAAAVASVPGVLLLFVVAALGRVVGDLVGFSYGRRQGAGLRDSSAVARLGGHHHDRVVANLERRGPLPVLLARLVPVPRAMAPATAGALGVPAGRFVAASIVASLAWSAVYVVVGVLMRASFPIAPKYLHVGGWVVVLVLAGIGVAYLAVRALTVRLQPGDVRRILGDSSAAGMTPHPTGETSLRQRLFHEDEWRTVPNVVSAVRILLLPVFGVLLVAHQFWAAIITLLVVFVTDFVDGFIARRFNQTSALGAWLDPVADRLTVVFVVAAFAASSIVPWQLVLILLIPDVLSGAWAVVAFNGAPDVRVSKVGKVRTALLFVGLFLMLFGEAAAPGSAGTAHAVLVGVGFALFVLGVVGHYLAMARNARGLVSLWLRPAAPAAAAA